MSRANVYASPYAIAHPDAYELVARVWQRGVPLVVELALVDATDRVIDEDGCNCDLDEPCNNPRCCMERDLEDRRMMRSVWHVQFESRPSTDPLTRWQEARARTA